MQEQVIYISSVDREKIGVSKTHDFKNQTETDV